ncbi:MAG: DMT family transporter [Bacteroidales bacterium]|nr:DMT family transporter [Bacteroidales bacterium]
MSEKTKGHLIVLATNIFFGLNIPISKAILSTAISPLGWSFLRVSFSCACFWMFSLFLPKEPIIKRVDFGLLLWCALFGLVFNQVSFIVGLTLTSPIDASIIATAVPVLVMLIAAVVLREPVTPTKVTGVLIGAAGALLLILSGSNAGVSGNSVQGDLLCLFSCFSYAIYLVSSKRLVQRYSSVTVMKWTFLFSTVLLFPFGVTGLKDCAWLAFDTTLWLQIAYALTFGTFIPYLLIPMGLKRLRPTTMSMYNYVQPMVASMVAVIAMQDTFSWVKCCAAALVFAGVYVVTKSKSRAQLDAEQAQKNRIRE